MKKYLLSLIIIAITSITAFSQTSCEVYGQGGTEVKLHQAIGSTGNDTSLSIDVRLTNPAKGTVRVSVGVYTLDGCKVKNAPMIEIPNEKAIGTTYVDGLEKNTTYQFKINSASCQH